MLNRFSPEHHLEASSGSGCNSDPLPRLQILWHLNAERFFAWTEVSITFFIDSVVVHALAKKKR